MAYSPVGVSEKLAQAKPDAAGESLIASFVGSLAGGFLGAAVGRAGDRELDALREVVRAARVLIKRMDARARRDSGVPRAWLDPLRVAVGRLTETPETSTETSTETSSTETADAARDAVPVASAASTASATSAETSSDLRGDGPRPVTPRRAVETKRR
jgi:hypothetical protein